MFSKEEKDEKWPLYTSLSHPIEKDTHEYKKASHPSEVTLSKGALTKVS